MTEKDEIDLLKIRVDQLEKLDQATQVMLKELSQLVDILISQVKIRR